LQFSNPLINTRQDYAAWAFAQTLRRIIRLRRLRSLASESDAADNLGDGQALFLKGWRVVKFASAESDFSLLHDAPG